MGVKRLLEFAESRFETTCLVSVYRTAGFWSRFGFNRPGEGDVSEKLKEKLKGYIEDAELLVKRNWR